jgi:hypothetical protein
MVTTANNSRARSAMSHDAPEAPTLDVQPLPSTMPVAPPNGLGSSSLFFDAPVDNTLQSVGPQGTFSPRDLLAEARDTSSFEMQTNVSDLHQSRRTHTSRRLMGQSACPDLFVPAAPLTTARPSDCYDRSIDLEPEDQLESHFIGSLAIPGLALNELDSAELSSATLSFRQVSRDPSLPAFFVKHPSLMYGRQRVNGRLSYDAVVRESCEVLDNAPGQCMSM